MSVEAVSVSNEFDIFATRPVQTSNIETTETAYKPIPSVDQSDFEFLITADGTELDATDYSALTNNFLHCISSQYSIALNGVR
jgi:hypothetical protein